ncbi:hypothetical protein COT42_03740 [Candidatus Saganbacteria bacterium CG08_land_8_20_14_0_20_45_16]|uniref:Uncharacterized protein n=1 Tax=Candidatus Saganbacteria bacterium CG08_land_8_20_14_0_20_45_16 TaxID=2014293 RepID=A0A2H0XYG0_UNCSA|nr:MAG: hypothetical protein COT42_03740 [Candidatus Saganbacteria bacterium CG08_land_8_20_14_0_20_45_16]
MPLIQAITSFIPLQIFSAQPEQHDVLQQESSADSYFCVSSENETDRNVAFVEFARSRCQISEFDIDAVPTALLERFSPAAPRSLRQNRWESLADYFDSTWFFIPLASVIRALAGPDYCSGSLIAVNQQQVCDDLAAAVVPPEPEPEPCPELDCRSCPAPRPRPRPVQPEPIPVEPPRPPRPTKVRQPADPRDVGAGQNVGI